MDRREGMERKGKGGRKRERGWDRWMGDRSPKLAQPLLLWR